MQSIRIPMLARYFKASFRLLSNWFYTRLFWVKLRKNNAGIQFPFLGYGADTP